MGLHNTAHYLKSKGRGTDTELVHMSKREIKGLQQLAMANGGSLTINPDTGLVEAGFLEQALPVVAAAAATYFTAGAAAPALSAALGSSMAGGIAAGALAGAGISGLTAAITGKDVGQAALMGGLGGAVSGGLGAYGEAPNLLADATQKTAVEAGTQAATQSATQGAVDAGIGAGTSGYGEANALLSTPTAPITPTPTPITAGMPTPAPGTPGGAPTQEFLNAYRPGIQQPSAPTPPADTYYASLKPDQYVQKAGILSLPALGLLGDQQQQQLGPEPEASPFARISPNFRAYVPPQPNPYYRAQYPTYAAEGGIMQSYQAGGPVERMTNMNTSMNPQGGLYPQGMIDKTQYATPTQRPTSMEVIESQPTYDARVNPMTGTLMAAGGLPKDAPRLSDVKTFADSDVNTRGLDALAASQYRNKKLMAKSGIKAAELPKTGIKSLGGDFSDMAAAGGTAHLGDYSDGGRLLKGPGDGMSDDIPATIGRKQPARLADSEFVVPADVVSHLGNGSTDAGAKRLYAMMDQVRQARTGRKKQSPAIKAEKYIPKV